jgi:hypothetical protein
VVIYKQTCDFCPLGTFKSLPEDTECTECPSTDSLPNCEFCINSDRCAKCLNGFFLNLSTYSCEETCNSETEVDIQFEENAFCRPREAYYINGESDSPFEFGTEEYPFKRAIWASRELFNLRVERIEHKLGFYYKRNTTTYHPTIAEVLRFA